MMKVMQEFARVIIKIHSDLQAHLIGYSYRRYRLIKNSRKIYMSVKRYILFIQSLMA